MKEITIFLVYNLLRIQQRFLENLEPFLLFVFLGNGDELENCLFMKEVKITIINIIKAKNIVVDIFDGEQRKRGSTLALSLAGGTSIECATVGRL